MIDRLCFQKVESEVDNGALPVTISSASATPTNPSFL
jgi:hypothetical protein